MKIAVVDVAAENGGAVSVLRDFYSYIVAHEMDTNNEWIFYTSVVDLEETESVKVYKNSSIKKNRINRWIWDRFIFRKIDQKEKFDIIISLQNAPVFAPGKKQIVYFHNVLLLADKKQFSLLKKDERKYAVYSKIISLYTKRKLQNVECVITQTNTVRNKIISEFKLEKDKIKVVNPNLPFNDTDTINIGFKKGFFYPANPEIFKNHILILEAFKRFKTNNIGELILTISGGESCYAQKIANYCKEIDGVILSGYLPRDKVLSLYNTHILIWASGIESFPIPFIEAMNCNDIIIVPDEDYAKEIIGSYPNCIFYKRGNVDSLVDAMERSLKIIPIQISMASKKQDNTWGKVVEIISNLYEEKNDFYNYGNL